MDNLSEKLERADFDVHSDIHQLPILSEFREITERIAALKAMGANPTTGDEL